MSMWGRAGRWDESDSWVKRHSLSLALAALFLAMTVGYAWAVWPVWAADQQTHGEAVVVGGDFARYAFSEWLVSITAEPWGFLVGVLFAKWFTERGSPESK